MTSDPFHSRSYQSIRRAGCLLLRSLLLATAWLLSSPQFAAATSSSTTQSEIHAALTDWMNDFNARDSSHICSLFAPDLISNYQGQPKGSYTSLCTQLKQSLANPVKTYHYDLRVDEILVSHDLAVVRLTWTLHVKQHDSPNLTIEEPGIDIFRRQPGGSWKIARFLAYPVPVDDSGVPATQSHDHRPKD